MYKYIIFMYILYIYIYWKSFVLCQIYYIQNKISDLDSLNYEKYLYLTTIFWFLKKYMEMLKVPNPSNHTTICLTVSLHFFQFIFIIASSLHITVLHRTIYNSIITYYNYHHSYISTLLICNILIMTDWVINKGENISRKIRKYIKMQI